MEASLANLIFRYVQLSFTAVHPPYQAPKKFLRLHTQVTIITLIPMISLIQKLSISSYLEEMDDIEENVEL